MIDWFNKLTSWVETEIVSVANVRDRTTVLSRFIQIAEHCIEIHNYSTGMGLVAALQAVSVARLVRTWHNLSRKELSPWSSLQAIFSNETNFSNYRRQLASAHGEPCLPYIGILLQDLLMVEELPTVIPTSKMVNFRKMRRFAGMLKEEILARQEVAKKYNFEVQPHVRDFIVQSPRATDAELYRLSRLCEPAPLA